MEDYRLNADEIAQVMGTITSKMVGMENVAASLIGAYNSGKNIILYGPGGQAKSMIAEIFAEKVLELKFNSQNVFKMTFSEGTDSAAPFGGLDMAEFKSSGKIQYNLESSFMNSPIAIFEEYFDAPGPALELMKDPITSGKFCYGTFCFHSKNKFIIACTNVNPKEWASNLSLQAFVQGRFPISVEVKLELNGVNQYRSFLAKTKAAPSCLEECAAICASIKAKDRDFSPRSAVYVAQIMERNGGLNLYSKESIKSLSPAAEKAIEKLEEETQNAKLKEKLTIQGKFIKDLNIEQMHLPEVLSALKILKTMPKELEAFVVPDNLMASFRDINQKIEQATVKCANKLTDFLNE